MSVTASDLKIYAASGQPEDNTTLAGGPIDLTTRIIFDDYVLANIPGTSGDGTLRYSSTNNGDSGAEVSVYGRNSQGSLVSETKALGNSGVAVTGEQVFERILKIEIDSHDYDVIVEDSADNEIATLESGVDAVRRLFYNVSSSPSEEKIYYDKCFVRNNHDTLALLNARFTEEADPSTFVEFALSDSLNDSDTFANRLEAPADTGADGFSSSVKTLNDNVGVADLGPGSGVALYLSLTLPSGESASKTYWTVGISGESI